MTAQVTWSINDLKYNAADGGVFEVRWSCTATDDQDPSCTAVEAGKEVWEYDTAAEDWVNIADLTEEVVLGWVKEHLGVDKVTEIEENRKGKVDAQVARKASVVSGLPWGESEVAPE
jgi:hypothetical protein